MIAGVFEVPASLLAWLYEITSSYAGAIAIIAVIVMVLVTPLNLKSTKGMLEMQRLAPEMRKLQGEHRDDRQKLNEEMMKLYQEHKVNPMASCLPLVAQMPVFIIMFRILHGMTYRPVGGNKLIAQAVLDAGGDSRPIGFMPRYLSSTSPLYESLARGDHMKSLGLDLSRSPAEMLGENFGLGLIFAGLVVVLGILYWVQQRMVAARAAVSPTMSVSQQKMMQYLPVAFAVFQIFFLLGLVVYYIVQTILRIAQQAYITKRFYSGEHSLGRQAQAASERARELHKDGGGAPGGLFGSLGGQKGASADKRAKDDGGSSGRAAKPSAAAKPAAGAPSTQPNKRTTAPKNRPTSTNSRSSRPASNRPGGSRPSSNNKRRKG
jgi:YidC/Oxa1 family membrane protein insertase